MGLLLLLAGEEGTEEGGGGRSGYWRWRNSVIADVLHVLNRQMEPERPVADPARPERAPINVEQLVADVEKIAREHDASAARLLGRAETAALDMQRRHERRMRQLAEREAKAALETRALIERIRLAGIEAEEDEEDAIMLLLAA